MGYYSSFKAQSTFTEEHRRELEKISGYGMCYHMDYVYLTGEECKWYECENDLKALSEKFPDALFVIERIGEVSPDMERIYSKNGQSTSIKPEIVWPEFDERMLT